MNGILLTQNDGMILGPIAKVLGLIMEGIFTVINAIGLPNIGLAIILFTIVVNLLMMPLTIKQQKFAKLSAKMNPELEAIRVKYKGKTDQDSQIAQNQEVQAVYAKYGVSPTGSCLYLLIQMPILFALYRVIDAIPAYVTKIGNTFGVLADKIISVDNAAFLKESGVKGIADAVMMYGTKMTDDNMRNGVIDVLNKLSSSDMAVLAEHYDLSKLTYEGQLIISNSTTTGLIDTYNNFLGVNMGNSPWYIIQESFASGAWLALLGALCIPLLSALTQWINTKLMPSQSNNDNKNMNDTASSMQQSMKTMNTIMPLMSAWFCFTLPSGMGLYWIAGSVVRSIQQILVNKYMDKLDFDEIIKKNSVKSAKKIEKMKEQQEKLNAYANMNTKNIQKKANVSSTVSEEEQKKAANNSSGYYNANAKPGSMMAKANMVRDYNERNNKGNK